MNYFLSFVDEEVMDISFHLIERIQNMNLNELENAMVAALVIMQPGQLYYMQKYGFAVIFFFFSRGYFYTPRL